MYGKTTLLKKNCNIQNKKKYQKILCFTLNLHMTLWFLQSVDHELLNKYFKYSSRLWSGLKSWLQDAYCQLTKRLRSWLVTTDDENPSRVEVQRDTFCHLVSKFVFFATCVGWRRTREWCEHGGLRERTERGLGIGLGEMGRAMIFSVVLSTCISSPYWQNAQPLPLLSNMELHYISTEKGWKA